MISLELESHQRRPGQPASRLKEPPEWTRHGASHPGPGHLPGVVPGELLPVLQVSSQGRGWGVRLPPSTETKLLPPPHWPTTGGPRARGGGPLALVGRQLEPKTVSPPTAGRRPRGHDHELRRFLGRSWRIQSQDPDQLQEEVQTGLGPLLGELGEGLPGSAPPAPPRAARSQPFPSPSARDPRGGL